MTWPPETEKDLQRAADTGLLAEAHDRDVKREVPRPGSRGNLDLATDMACMAVDRGLLFYGVDGAADPPQLVPFDLAGVRERIDQVSKALINEPLHVRVIEIRSSGDPERGYVVVVVPPSPARPHMVRGRYRGAGTRPTECNSSRRRSSWTR